ncbi:LysR substrate-binding domain-containing protein [Pantoea sp. B65]|uniref:LysR substrate-binding domain-containing protein n=1 Tax=Pantoea sp. B65 TaxID=2813359 RepID=UPI0039B550F2
MTRQSLPLNAIHAFIVTARHLNLTHAATELCLTQGAVSRKIAALEAWLSFPLFERHARGLKLTPQGAALLPELKSGFEQMLNATGKARKSNTSVRLKAPTCAMRWLLPKLMALEQMRPEIHVSLTTTVDHSNQLDNFDAAIVYGAPLEKGWRLFDEELTPVISGSLLKQQTIAPQDLTHFTFLHPTADSADWQLWLRAQQLEITMKRNQHFATMDLAISAAIQGYGVTVADVTLIQSDLATQRLVAPFSSSVKTGAVYSLLQRPDKDAPPFLTELVAWLCLEGNPFISATAGG